MSKMVEFNDQDPRYLDILSVAKTDEDREKIKELCHAFQDLEAKEENYRAFKNVVNSLS